VHYCLITLISKHFLIKQRRSISGRGLKNIVAWSPEASGRFCLLCYIPLALQELAPSLGPLWLIGNGEPHLESLRNTCTIRLLNSLFIHYRVLSVVPVFRINSATGRNLSCRRLEGEVLRKAPEIPIQLFWQPKYVSRYQIFKNIPATDVSGAGIAQSV
jgi:hypothetical protein